MVAALLAVPRLSDNNQFSSARLSPLLLTSPARSFHHYSRSRSSSRAASSSSSLPFSRISGNLAFGGGGNGCGGSSSNGASLCGPSHWAGGWRQERPLDGSALAGATQQPAKVDRAAVRYGAPQWHR